jgi:hypothetical protein
VSAGSRPAGLLTGWPGLHIEQHAMTLTEHNQRVHALADKMPADMLARAVCAIGYRASSETGITSGFSVATLASQSRKQLGGSYAISARQLNRAILILKSAGVIRVKHPPAVAGRKQPNVYHLDYGYTDISRLTEVYEMGKRQRRRQRQTRQVGNLGYQPGPSGPPKIAPVDDPEWLQPGFYDREIAKCPEWNGPCETSPWQEGGKWVCHRCGQEQPNPYR